MHVKYSCGARARQDEGEVRWGHNNISLQKQIVWSCLLQLWMDKLRDKPTKNSGNRCVLSVTSTFRTGITELRRKLQNTWEKTPEWKRVILKVCHRPLQQCHFLHCFRYSWHIILIYIILLFSLFMIHRQLQLWQVNSALTFFFILAFSPITETKLFSTLVLNLKCPIHLTSRKLSLLASTISTGLYCMKIDVNNW